MERFGHGERVPKDDEGGGKELDEDGLVRRAEAGKEVAVEDVVDAVCERERDGRSVSGRR
jgi:hypothetical protein